MSKLPLFEHFISVGGISSQKSSDFSSQNTSQKFYIELGPSVARHEYSVIIGIFPSGRLAFLRPPPVLGNISGFGGSIGGGERAKRERSLRFFAPPPDGEGGREGEVKSRSMGFCPNAPSLASDHATLSLPSPSDGVTERQKCLQFNGVLPEG